LESAPEPFFGHDQDIVEKNLGEVEGLDVLFSALREAERTIPKKPFLEKGGSPGLRGGK